MRWIMSGLAILAGVMGLTTVAVAGNGGLSPNVFNVDAHFNHFHVYVKPPVLTDIETSNNLLAAQEEPATMILAAATSLTVTDVGAASSPANAAKTRYDAVYSMCGPMHSADQVPSNIERDNLISPAGAIDSYFESRGILPNFATGLGAPEPILVRILKSPEHGDLVVRNKFGTAFTYHANQDYLGSDKMIFEVEVMGKKFKVIQTVVIHDSGNLDYPTDAADKEFDRVCPSKKGSSLDIIELPTDGFASDEELANLHSMLSFALGSEFSGNGGSWNIADLPNAAIGQTTGSTITLINRGQTTIICCCKTAPCPITHSPKYPTPHNWCLVPRSWMPRLMVQSR